MAAKEDADFDSEKKVTALPQRDTENTASAPSS